MEEGLRVNTNLTSGQTDLEARNSTLKEIIATGQVTSPDGQVLSLHSHVSAIEANALYELVKKRQPRTVLEVGMAFGVSSLAILTALDELGAGSLTSVDPNQIEGEWKGTGLANVRRAGFASRHTLIEQSNFLALPRLFESGMKIDLAYIDGWHTFEYALLDFFFIDKMLAEHGVVGFNDAGWPSVHKVIKFLLRHRKYVEIDVGLPTVYRARHFHTAIARRILNAPTQDRYFEKLAQWEPPFNYFANF